MRGIGGIVGMDYSEDRLTEEIIRAIIRVHTVLGPGCEEKVYRNALIHELELRGLAVDREHVISIYYEGIEVGRHRLDLLVENRIIVELKVVDELGKAHYAQLRSYLKSTGLQVGILVNFALDKADFRRVLPR